MNSGMDGGLGMGSKTGPAGRFAAAQSGLFDDLMRFSDQIRERWKVSHLTRPIPTVVFFSLGIGWVSHLRIQSKS